jgi:exopolysaccharide biosynthesis protein
LIGADASTASTAAQTGFVLSQGPLAAAYDTDPDQTAEAAVVFTARIPGAGGNALDIQYVDDVLNPTVPYVTVASGVVKVHIDTGVTLASAVVSAVNAAVVPVTAELKSGNDGSGVVVTMAAQSLADGRDEGRIRLTATTVSGVTADVVRVAWVGRA